MTGPDTKLMAAAETYFADLRQVRASGGGTGERSYYPALAGLLGAVGDVLKPKVFCVLEGADQGAGHPDCALYTARQVQKGQPRYGQVPERGVVEVKGTGDDAWLTAESNQVTRYWGRYRLVLVTNLRDFVLVGGSGSGDPTKLETFRLAEDANEFWSKVEKPRAFASEVGAALGEYLARALSHRAALAEPRDLAWLLASYARDGLARVEAVGDTPSLLTVREALEEVLGIRFTGERGDRFFRSTLIQTLFYGVFSAWVLWSREEQKKNGPLFEGHYSPQQFRWREASWHLRAPVLRALFRQLSDPGGLHSLTGWEPHANKPLPFPELEDERDRAERVKRDTPILVILGNPPYDGFAGVAVGHEERALSEAYRTTQRVREPKGQGLNDPYVRFYRMAERRIAEKTGQGVVCFISNYSWLDKPSFTGMRERYLEAFDAIRIDCLNGDKYQTGKVAPDGSPDPSIFSTEADPVGIQVGTAIATLVRLADHESARSVAFRHLWGQEKPAELIATAEAEPDALYTEVEPLLPLGLPFVETVVGADWFDWPALPDLFPVSFPGVKTSRDGFLVDTDIERLRSRVGDYFDPALSHEEIARRHPRVMKSTARFDARATRDALLRRGGPDDSGFIRFAYRPFDNRWLYWEKDTKLLDEKRADYRPHAFEGNVWLSAAQHLRKGAEEPQAYSTDHMGSLHLIERGALMFPGHVREEGLGYETGTGHRPNLSAAAKKYLGALGANVDDLFHHVLATLHDPAYREANAGALRMEWPRIPLPGWPDGKMEGAVESLVRSAARGRKVAALLDSRTSVPGVTQVPLRPEIAVIAVPSTVAGRNMTSQDFAVTAGWGYSGPGDAVMPGRGRIVERAYTGEESAAIGKAMSALGDKTFDVHLNGEAFWRNIPAAVWDYRLGGYQVLKKWLSYRERDILGRNLRAGEVQLFADTARRIGALLMMSDSDPTDEGAVDG